MGLRYPRTTHLLLWGRPDTRRHLRNSRHFDEAVFRQCVLLPDRTAGVDARERIDMGFGSVPAQPELFDIQVA